MATVTVRCLVLSFSLAGLAFSGTAVRQDSNPSLTAHEWGTFTSVADGSGKAVKWLPLNGSPDLPRFVEHFRTAELKVGLSGTVRMETPVLYFYSPNETTVSVKVGFSKGVITEWYPHASHIEPDPKLALPGEALFERHTDGSIAWNSVTLTPGLAEDFPVSDSANHYYAARQTAATPLIVKAPAGDQHEKFLFYRGVSTHPIPISARTTADGRVLVRNLGEEEIPALMLLERRGDKVGYRISRDVQQEVSLEPPDLKPLPVEAMSDLEDILESQGLYADEAHAMIQTWGDSWLEEGTHLFYIVPRHFVDTILPLSISPAPGQVVRVFVGRLELITPATERAVEAAVAARDRSTIDKYGRFLEPIMEQLKAENPARAHELNNQLNQTYAVGVPEPPAR
jgi:hypothetical protein